MRVGGTINRRIGGLEISIEPSCTMVEINRRIGGLETKAFMGDLIADH